MGRDERTTLCPAPSAAARTPPSLADRAEEDPRQLPPRLLVCRTGKLGDTAHGDASPQDAVGSHASQADVTEGPLARCEQRPS